MKEIKKANLSADNSEVVTMTFDDNPNIPTANYNDATASKIEQAIQNKLKKEKMQKLLEQELKEDAVKAEDPFAMKFSFKGM